ncbi:MAG: molecular chaperone TorD family protein [Acidobacteria bacterium]|nr:molecular chaperone TorD family protein [Acidobacteriota bacterium]
MYNKINYKEFLVEATEWRLISLLFECPKDDWKKKVKMLAKEVLDPDLKDAAKFACKEATEGLYHSILGPGGPAPAREISYSGGWTQPGYLMSELDSYYQAFSYQPVTKETLDHISVETGFISYLRLKEAYALECGAIEQVEITSQSAKTFINEHLTVIAQPLAEIMENLEVSYLEYAAKALFKRVGTTKNKPLPIYQTSFQENDSCEFSCSVETEE